MTQALRILNYFETVINGRAIDGGSRSDYQEKTISDPYFDKTWSIPIDTTIDAWGFSGVDESLSDFDYCFIQSDKSGLYAEFTVDNNATYGTEVFALGIGTIIPLILPTNAAYANYTADFAAGTIDVIDKIRLRNPTPNAAGTALVRLVLFS